MSARYGAAREGKNKGGPMGYKHTTPPESSYALLSYFSQWKEGVKYDSGGVKCL
ncbi:MAG: hypothetical protein SF052_18700 [Bacteroidia bacterium]|nr:hypothetical protein [Bacteroidia bacterium]